MRKTMALLALLLSGAVLAGCLDGPDRTDERPAEMDAASYVPPAAAPVVDAEDLLADHEAFVTAYPVRKGEDPRHEGAREALTTLFESYGLEVYRHDFEEGGLEQANIVGIQWGHDRHNWVVVGGHYDTTTNVGPEQSQGAYDDGSGTMITVHLAKAFSNVTPYYTMAFIAYDGEERGLQGAQAFVDQVVTADESPYGDIDIVGTVDLDMIGINWPGTQAPVTLLSNSEAIAKAADDKRVSMEWPDGQWHRKPNLNEAGLLALGTSDYGAYMKEGIPTIFFISDFIELGFPAPSAVPVPPQAGLPVGVYPFWHQVDTVDSMTAMAGGHDNLAAGFQAISDVAAQILFELACHPTMEWDGVVSDA
ncbi:MAG TPA: M28 family peptidase [Candidatus Thermoplasmatota archaeon]|nr:M28 family peptidase [Candidatus Thermoplasmatota archaeon]